MFAFYFSFVSFVKKENYRKTECMKCQKPTGISWFNVLLYIFAVTQKVLYTSLI